MVATDFALPQGRVRVYIVGLRRCQKFGGEKIQMAMDGITKLLGDWFKMPTLPVSSVLCKGDDASCQAELARRVELRASGAAAGRKWK